MTNLLTLFIFLARARSSTIDYCGAAVKNVTLACFSFYFFSFFFGISFSHDGLGKSKCLSPVGICMLGIPGLLW